MNDELRSPPEKNPVIPHVSSAPTSKLDICATTETLVDLLGDHSDRDLLLILMGQMIETRTEVRILQATVNTLLVELCNRQPEKLSQSLTRMSAQRRQDLLTDLRTQSEAFDRRSRDEPGK